MIMKLNFIFKSVAILVVMLASAACSGINPDAEMNAAEAAINEGDYERANDICKSLLDKDDSKMTAAEYARLSMLFMQLTDPAVDGDGVSHAAQCWQKAMAINADSARHFYSTVPVEQQKNVVLLNAIVSMFDRSADFTDDYEETDSLPYLPEDHDIDPSDSDHIHE